MSTPRVGSVTRLQAMPVLFSVSDLAQRSGLTAQVARQTALRWRKQSLIEAVGPHLGLYYNKVKDPNSPDTYRARALQRIYPSAVLIGPSVLHEAGLVTQIPSTLHVAISSNILRPARVEGVTFFLRPPGWYKATAPGRMSRTGGMNRVFGLPALLPAWTLVDSFYGEAGWQPDPDDLINVTPGLVKKVEQVCDTLGLPYAPIRDFYSFYTPSVGHLPEF